MFLINGLNFGVTQSYTFCICPKVHEMLFFLFFLHYFMKFENEQMKI